MSFVSKLKSPLKIKKLFKHHQNADNAPSQQEDNYDESKERDLLIFHIDADNFPHLAITMRNSELGKVLIDRVCVDYHLNDYAEYFGLKYTSSDNKNKQEILWLDPLKSIGKQLKHSTNNILTIRVKHFPGDADKIECEQVRYLIYLQLKAYMQKGHLKIPHDIECKLVACVLQSTYGNYDAELDKQNYIENEKLISKKSLVDSVKQIHKSLIDKTPNEAELIFLREISKLDVYGAEIVNVRNKKNIPVNMGASHKGIMVYLSDQSSQIDLFPWSQIGKINMCSDTISIYFHHPDKINPEEMRKEKMTFLCSNEHSCRQLWKHILDQKAFFTFNRGTDVPTIKSSKRLFHRTAKFRFSGRCESEIVNSQNSTPRSSNGSFTFVRRQRVKIFEQNESTLKQDEQLATKKSFIVEDLNDNFEDVITSKDGHVSMNIREQQQQQQQSVQAEEDLSFKSIKEMKIKRDLNNNNIELESNLASQRSLFKRNEKSREKIDKFSAKQIEEFNAKVASIQQNSIKNSQKNSSIKLSNTLNLNDNEQFVSLLMFLLFFLVILLFIFKVFNICDLSAYISNFKTTSYVSSNSNYIFYKLFSNNNSA